MHSHFLQLVTSPPAPVGVRSIAMSVSVCLYVCLSVCLSVHISKATCPNFTKFMYMLPVAVARSSSNDNAICYVLPVLFMTSCFPIMPHTVYRDSTFPRYLNLIRQREPALFTVYCEETADCVNQCYCCCHLRERLCDRGRSLLSSVALLCDYFAFASALHRTFSSRN